MSLLPDYITENNYREAKTWFLESNICLTRAWIIFINTILHNQNDFHGSVEALQHSNELSIKSLYLLVGLDWEFGHNPAKNIDEVMDSPYSVVFEQAGNRMWAQMGLLVWLLNDAEK